MQLLHNIMMYQKIFQRLSAHMSHFSRVVIGIYPHLARWENIAIAENDRKNLYETSTSLDRKDMLTEFKLMFFRDEKVKQESERDCALASVEIASRKEKLKADRLARDI